MVNANLEFKNKFKYTHGISDTGVSDTPESDTGEIESLGFAIPGRLTHRGFETQED